ncbi:MAG TPA: Asp-tRNA(Asn)/Glu-tRNA(Gln) amidotransferase subunit GatB [Patescibacteria group bacterium]|nr:Asp-tRNA(Asn)/Glu-tRNA(Gln) amidotransferase subunit GatB [Patescibacteria group bacterium]
MAQYIPTIGLEIHIQLKTKSKMFCGCDNNAEGKAPNSVVCPICLGMPGTLPVANKQAIEWTVKLGKYLGGNIEPLTKFDRKHYFYPDLPKGYQISQYDHPIVRGGQINLSGRAIELTRIHLEEDAGKLVHPKGKDYSLVDLNRAGTPLMEVVTEPMIKSPAEAKAFLQRLRLVVRYLDITDADMEKGHFRCDANVSVTAISNVKFPMSKLGVPVEIKNLNSFLMVEKALAYEIKRQTEILARGEKVSKETRGWDDAKGVTIGQRSKELAPDYRYFPEPDLPAMLALDKEFNITLPESIDDKIARAKKLGLSDSDIETIFSDHNLVDTFDSITKQKTDNKVAQKAVSLAINFSAARRLSGEQLVELAELSSAGAIGPQSIRPLINEVLEKGVSIEQAVRDGGFAQESDSDKIREVARLVIADHQAAVNDYRSGKKTAAGYLVGQIMKASKGKANPQMVNKILVEELR